MKPTASQTVIHESLSQLREALRGCGQTTQPGMRLPSFSITQVCDALIKCYTSKDDPYWVRNLSDCITGFLEMATHANDQFVILAGSAPEAEIWARAMHLQPKQCIYASSPMRVTGISNAKVVTLPGFVNHRDRWAILDMVNSARGTGTVTDYVEELENSTMSDGKKPDWWRYEPLGRVSNSQLQAAKLTPEERERLRAQWAAQFFGPPKSECKVLE